jgi:hypothetical protein
MSIELLNKALKVQNLSPTKKLILLILANYADENGSCYPSHQHLANLCGLQTTKSIKSAIKEFESLGFLKKQNRKLKNGGNTSNRYIFNFDENNPRVLEEPRVVSERNHNTKEDTKEIYMESFELFWNLYPRKVSKKKTLSIFLKIDLKEFDDIVKGVRNLINTNTEIKYIPHPSTWLNQERWKDEYIDPKTNLNTLAG